ncbi:MAG: hypothetical protein QW041_02880 [Candidatus Pacearchaeota archaeon]
MNLKETFEFMKNAGYVLPKKCYSLQEAKVGINPKTGAMMYRDINGKLWSYDKLENHFDVLDRTGKYLRINLEGVILGMKQSTFAYVH